MQHGARRNVSRCVSFTPADTSDSGALPDTRLAADATRRGLLTAARLHAILIPLDAHVGHEECLMFIRDDLSIKRGHDGNSTDRVVSAGPLYARS